MTIPPFPSQDLAKLILGYLAEEQLMTAYDEFLQASPYLDALRNEYDRIFMTSLKNILAEYRAVKICVETCKPFILRRKLLQCVNLLEIVKFLIQNVDINKLNTQEHNVDKTSSIRNTNVVLPNIAIQPGSQSMSAIGIASLESSVETTSLDDLPGNVTTKKKSMKILDREARNSHTSTCELDNEQVSAASPSSSNTFNLSVVDNTGSTVNDQVTNNFHTKELMKSNKAESVQKIEEFNNILDYVCKNGTTAPCRNYSVSDKVASEHQRVSMAGTFQDFTTGIYNNDKDDLPVSNTTENNNAQAPLRRNVGNTFVNIGTINAADIKSNSHLILTVDSIAKNQRYPTKTTAKSTITQNNTLTQVNSLNREDKKVKILSDIKVDKGYDSMCRRLKMPPVLSNATSTPFQMQTILINGTPVYENKTQCGSSHNYTKDEIMAMPTIILVPATGTKSNVTESQPTISLPKNTSSATVTTSSAQDFHKPLVIDVTSNIKDPEIIFNEEPTIIQSNNQTVLTEQNLVKTVEVTGYVSVPKDNALSTIDKTSTPQGLLPKRKSSSTPRRTSHIRVLDFTTPRRILHETINEQSSNSCSVNAEHSATSLSSCKESDGKVENIAVTENISCIVNVDCTNLNNSAAKENKVKKGNWDADLRALAVDVNEINTSSKLSKSRYKTKAKGTKKKKAAENKPNKSVSVSEKIEKIAKKNSVKVKYDEIKSKSKIASEGKEDVVCKSEEKVPLVVKPTINIISGNDWCLGQENDKLQNKSNSSNDRTNTPETDRIALQNAIGAKLNISELLETPYKQALYDIQMETPRFLGPDIPDVPISDVKIMNIPTPRFLCSPKGAQATPPSYSSRPTDYSSGSSYYKPDDQDYIISTEVLECPITEGANIKKSKNDEKNYKKYDEKIDKIDKEPKTSRPVRQCRKNVSYYKNPNASSKAKESEENSDGSDATSINNSVDNKIDNKFTTKDAKLSSTKAQKKLDSNKKLSSSKKYKSPVKGRTPKTFMKIKPRRTTPIKETLGGKSRKLSDSSQNKQQKRTNSKDRNVNFLPVTASVPTKSRRKSSTPRKLHCTKTFNSESSGHNSPVTSKSKQDMSNVSPPCSNESDIEQLPPLRWSDDGSQDGKSKENRHKLESISVNESDDISKIKEYIETSTAEKQVRSKDGEVSLHIDLIKRGFDIETAKIIERDLLDSPRSKQDSNANTVALEHCEIMTTVSVQENTASSTSTKSINLDIDEDDESDGEDVDFSVHECNEDTANYIKHHYDDSNYALHGQPATLKDNFSMEICIEDGVTVRLRATKFNVLLDHQPQEREINYFCKETELAVSTILNIEKLYTPMKDHKTEVYEIFDSTLTSLDTPLKVNSPKSFVRESIVAELALEVEKEKFELKKRKRLHSGASYDESTNCNKKPKPETQYLLNTANIQNIDIESVLSKLHGP